jgi:hypothetical protein
VQHPQSKNLELLVHLSREDRVMDQETVGMIAWNRFAKLLQGPGCRWMCGDVAMHDASCPNLHKEEHVESSKPSGHHNQEIAGDDGLGVIADKRLPVLRTGPPVALAIFSASKCVACLDLIVQGDRDNWALIGVDVEARQIIKAALDSGQHDAVMVARRLVELLIARGQYGFRTLLS